MNQSLEPAFASVSAFAPAPLPAREPVPEIAGACAASAPTDAEGGSAAGGLEAPAALAGLVAAGLVSHEMIGDPARLRGEAATLRVLCAHVPGSIWRIEPYHYAFRLESSPGDPLAPGGAGLPETPERAAAALEARLAAELGADAAWVSATDLIADEAARDRAADRAAAAVDLDAPLLLLRAGAAAVADGLACAGAGVQAVVSAGFAVRAARIAAGRLESETGSGPADPGLDLRLAALEAGQGRIEAALAAAAEDRAAAAAAKVRLNELLAEVLRRLDAQADVLHGHIARDDQVAGRLGEIAALASAAASTAASTGGGAAAGFQETLGLTLAEFLARLERRETAAGQPTSQEPSRLPQAR